MNKLQLSISTFELQAAVSKSEFPFVALVTYGNSVSDFYVGGTENLPGGPYRVMIPADTLSRNISRLEGKPVFVSSEFDSHTDTKTVGEFVHAWTEPVMKEEGAEIALAARASGILHRDFDTDLVDATVIKARAGVLGFSYDIEANQFEFVTIEGGEKIVKLVGFTWKGATILFRNTAAYRSTQLAAMKSERERNKDAMEESKVTEMLEAAMNGLTEKLTAAFTEKITSGLHDLKTEIMEEIGEDLKEVKASIESMKQTGEGDAGDDGNTGDGDPQEISVDSIAEAVMAKVGSKLEAVSKEIEKKISDQIKAIPLSGQRKSQKPHFVDKYDDKGKDGKGKVDLRSGAMSVPETIEEYEELKKEIKASDLPRVRKTALLAKLLPYKKDLVRSR